MASASTATPSPRQKPSASSDMPKSPKSVRFQDERPSFLDKLSIFHLILLGGLFRLGLVAYGVYHDSTHTLKYTDIDYYVFSDAADYVLQPSLLASGPLSKYLAERWSIYIGSPYERATYRYTPLLALLLLPNIGLTQLFGKFLFSSADLGIALLQYHTLTHGKTSISIKQAKAQERQAKILVSSIWLLNPFVANISTRGSAESILGFIILLFVHLLQTDQYNAAAIVFGLAVHFKIYPVIYASTILAYLATSKSWLNQDQLRFAMVSFGSFMLLNIAMYSVWGMPFVEHTYLYHLSRLDHRHNFSNYFYQIYLSSSQLTTATTSPVQVIRKLASSSFIPQLSLSLGLGFLLTRSRESERISARISKLKSNCSQPNSLASIFLIQTVVFTTFNRVCTSQYFMWYLWFLPLALPSLRLSWKKGLAMLIAWVASQAIWLNYGYQLEFLGEPVYRELWMASLGFFVVNVGLIWTLIGQLEP